MTVTEFFEKYNGDISELNVRTYVPIEEKMKIINTSVKGVVKSEDKFIATYNSITVDVARAIAVISTYTGLTFESLEDYDRIIETGVLDSWLHADINDRIVFEYYFDLRLEDIMREENSVDGIINRIMKTLGETLDTLDPKTINSILTKIAER